MYRLRENVLSADNQQGRPRSCVLALGYQMNQGGKYRKYRYAIRTNLGTLRDDYAEHRILIWMRKDRVQTTWRHVECVRNGAPQQSSSEYGCGLQSNSVVGLLSAVGVDT